MGRLGVAVCSMELGLDMVQTNSDREVRMEWSVVSTSSVEYVVVSCLNSDFFHAHNLMWSTFLNKELF